MPGRDSVRSSSVDLVREFWGLWRNDGFDELLARYDGFFTEDLEWHSPVARMAGRSYVGRAGLAQHLADLRESFTNIKADPTTIAEIAPDVVRSDVLIHGEGPTSGVIVDAPLVALVRLREGRIYWTWASFDLAAGRADGHSARAREAGRGLMPGGEHNVDLVRRLMAAHNSGPEAFLARYDEFCDPDCEWIPAIVGSLERTAYRGRDGFRRWYAERDDALEQASVEITSCTAVDEDVVLLLGRSHARGRTSGAVIDAEVGIVFRVREGLVVHDQAFNSHREAREAAHA